MCVIVPVVHPRTNNGYQPVKLLCKFTFNIKSISKGLVNTIKPPHLLLIHFLACTNKIVEQLETVTWVFIFSPSRDIPHRLTFSPRHVPFCPASSSVTWSLVKERVGGFSPITNYQAEVMVKKRSTKPHAAAASWLLLYYL